MRRIRRRGERKRPKKIKKRRRRRSIDRVRNHQVASRDPDPDRIREYPKKRGNKIKKNR